MKTTFRSQELSCPSCVAKIEKALTSLNGVQQARVFFNSGRIEVEHQPDIVSADELIESIRAVGYEANVSPY